MRQKKELLNKHPDGVKLICNGDDPLDIQAEIEGPKGTPYQSGVFKVKIVIYSEFPNMAPKGYFMTKIFHPNVSETGEICVNTLKKDWNPKSWSLFNIFEVIKCLLIVPFPESSLNQEAGKIFMENYEEYFKIAQIFTQVHANRSKNESNKNVITVEHTKKQEEKNVFNQFDNSDKMNNIYNSDNNRNNIINDLEIKQTVENYNVATPNNNYNSCISNPFNNLNNVSNNIMNFANSNYHINSSSNNGYSIRNSQKENNNNYQYPLSNTTISEDELLRAEEYSSQVMQNDNNVNTNINNNILIRHSKSVFIKSQNNPLNSLFHTHLDINSNISGNNNNNLNFKINCLGSNSNNFFRTNETENNRNPSNNGYYNIFAGNKKYETGNLYDLRKGSIDSTLSNSVTSCNSFSRMSSQYFQISNDVFSVQSLSSAGSIDMCRKPSLDNLPFMRSNSQSVNDFSNLQNINPNISSKVGCRSKKEDMKKWLSRI